ncbi:uncharacterized protein LOC133560501 [Nerophis ophidion]|uniref:uncharacterized protein LOC133560501 n=1 Tax=Nerophis ophidion TaxID=159077 RepID=UPI002ADFF4FD|nr:uncharacterized protein LOC133560501 [Nerophis ophidion]
MSNPPYNPYGNQRRPTGGDFQQVSSVLGTVSSLSSPASPLQTSDKTFPVPVPNYQPMERASFNEDLQWSVDTHVSRAREEVRLQGKAIHQPSAQDTRRQEFISAIGRTSSYQNLSRNSGNESNNSVGSLNCLSSYSRATADKASVHCPSSTLAGYSVFNVSSEGQRDFHSIPGLDIDRPNMAQTGAAYEHTKPKYTFESATNILLQFGLEKEDLEHLIAYSEDQITPANLPFILRQIRIQKNKKASDADRPKAIPEPALTGGSGGLTSWGGSGMIGLDHGDAASLFLQRSKVIDYGHTHKYNCRIGEDAASVAKGAEDDTLLMNHNLDRGTRTEAPAQQVGKSACQDQASAGSSLSSTLTQKSNIAVIAAQTQPMQTQKSMFTTFSKDNGIGDNPSLAPKARPLIQAVADLKTTIKPQPLSTQFRDVHPSRPVLSSDTASCTSEQPKSQGVVGAKQVKNLETKQQQQKKNLEKAQPTKKDNKQQPVLQKQQVLKDQAKQKFTQLPCLLRKQMCMPVSMPPALHIPSLSMAAFPAGQSSGSKPHPQASPAQTVVSKGGPTTSMVQDYSAVTPSVFPHTCVLCYKECALIEDWIAHQNTTLHLENCKVFRKQFPNWDGDLLSVSDEKRQKTSTSTSQSHHKKSQRKSRSSSCSRSPRHRRRSNNRRDKRSDSRSRYNSRYSHRSRSRSRSYERHHSLPRSQEWHSSSPEKRSNRLSSSRRSRDRYSSLRSRERRSSTPTQRNKRSSPKRYREWRSPSHSRRSKRSSSKIGRERRSSSQSPRNKRSSPKRSRKRRSSSQSQGSNSSSSSRSRERQSSSPGQRNKRSSTYRSDKRRSSPRRNHEGNAEGLAKKLLKSSAVQSLSKQSDMEAVVKTLAPALLAELAKMKSPLSKGGTSSSQSTAATKKSAACSSEAANKKGAKATVSKQKDSSAKNKPGETSAPTFVTLEGIVLDLTYGDMVAAAEQYGKIKSLVLFRARRQAVVCYEKKEDAEKFRDIKNFELKGFQITVMEEKGTLSKKNPQKKPDASNSVSTTQTSKSTSTPSTKRAVLSAEMLVSKAKNVSCKQVTKTVKGPKKKDPVKTKLKTTFTVKSAQGSKVIREAPKCETLKSVASGTALKKEEEPSKCRTAEKQLTLKVSSELIAIREQNTQPKVVDAGPASVTESQRHQTTQPEAANAGPTSVTEPPRDQTTQPEAATVGLASLTKLLKDHTTTAETASPEEADVRPTRVKEPPKAPFTQPEMANVARASMPEPPRDHTAKAKTTPPEAADVGRATLACSPEQAGAPKSEFPEPMVVDTYTKTEPQPDKSVKNQQNTKLLVESAVPPAAPKRDLLINCQGEADGDTKLTHTRDKKQEQKQQATASKTPPKAAVVQDVMSSHSAEAAATLTIGEMMEQNLLPKRFVIRDGDLLNVSDEKRQKTSTSTSQSHHKKSQRKSRSSSCSRSPRHRRSSDNRRDTRSDSHSRYNSRHSRRSRSRSRSYERHHSLPRSQERHSSSPKKKSNRLSSSNRSRDRYSSLRSRERQSSSPTQRNKRSSPKRYHERRSSSRSPRNKRSSPKRSRKRRSSSQSQGSNSSSSSRSRERQSLSPGQRNKRSSTYRSDKRRSSPRRSHETNAEGLAKKLLKSSAVQSLSKQSDMEAVVKTLAPVLLAELAKMKYPLFKGGTSSSQSTATAKKSAACSSEAANKKGAKATASKQKDSSAKNKPGETSAPTFVTLEGIVPDLTYGDMVAAAEQYGKIKSLVLFRDRLQAVVCYEKREDAEKFRDIKNFELKGFPITVMEKKGSFTKKNPQKKPDASNSVSTTQISKSACTPSTKRAVLSAERLVSKAKNVSCKQVTKTVKGPKKKVPVNKRLKTTFTVKSAQGSKVIREEPKCETLKSVASGTALKKEEEPSKCRTAEKQLTLKVSSELIAIREQNTQPKVVDAGPASVTESQRHQTTQPEAANAGPASVTEPPRDQTTQPEAASVGLASLTKLLKDHTTTAETAFTEAADVRPTRVKEPPKAPFTQPEMANVARASMTEPPRDHTAKAKTTPPEAADIGRATLACSPEQAGAPKSEFPEPMVVDTYTKTEPQPDKSVKNQQNTKLLVESAVPPAAPKRDLLINCQGEADGDTKLTHARDKKQEQKQQATASKTPPKAAVVQDVMSSHSAEAAATLTIGEMMEQHLLQKRIVCLKKKTCISTRFRSLNKTQLLITHLPIYDGSYSEEDIARLLEPFGFKYSDKKIYVIPQTCMAFVQMENAKDVLAAYVASRNKTFALEGCSNKLQLHVLGTYVSMLPDGFYQSLMAIMNYPVNDFTSRTIFIKNISPSETISLREDLRKIGFVKNFLPLLSKLFVEFESDCDADRFGVWCSLLNRCPAYEIYRLWCPEIKCPAPLPMLPEKAMLDSSLAVAWATLPTLEFSVPEGSYSPFFLTISQKPYLFPTTSCWFSIPEFLTITEEADINEAERRDVTAPTIMLTGFNADYSYEQVAKLVWPYISQKDLQSLYYNVIVLPTQRRSFVHFSEWSACCRFLNSHLKTEVLDQTEKLSVHFVLSPMCPESSEENLYKSLMQLSNARVGQVETLAERLLCVNVSWLNEYIVKQVLDVVTSHAEVVNFLPLDNRICIEMADTTGVKCVEEKSNDLSTKLQCEVKGFESVNTLKRRLMDHSVITLCPETDRKKVSFQAAVCSTVTAAPSAFPERTTKVAQQQTKAKDDVWKTVAHEEKQMTSKVEDGAPGASVGPYTAPCRLKRDNTGVDFTEDRIPPSALICEPFKIDDFVTVDEVGEEKAQTSSTELSSNLTSKQTNTRTSKESMSSECPLSSTRTSSKCNPSSHSMSQKSKSSFKPEELKAESQKDRMITVATKENVQVLDSVSDEEKPSSEDCRLKELNISGDGATEVQVTPEQHPIRQFENDTKQICNEEETSPQVDTPRNLDEANKYIFISPLKDKGDEQKTNRKDDKEVIAESCQTNKNDNEKHSRGTSGSLLCKKDPMTSLEEEAAAYQVIDSVEEQPTSTKNKADSERGVTSSSRASKREEHESSKTHQAGVKDPTTSEPPKAEQKYQVVDYIQVQQSSSRLTPDRRRRSTRGKTQGPTIKDEETTFHILDSVDTETVQEETSITTRSSRGKRGRPPTKDAPSGKRGHEEMTPTRKRTRTSQETTRIETPTKKIEPVHKDKQKSPPATRGRGRPKKSVETTKSEDDRLDAGDEEEATFTVLDCLEDEMLHDEGPAKEGGGGDDEKEGKDNYVGTSQHTKCTQPHHQPRHSFPSSSEDNTTLLTVDKVGEVDDKAFRPNWRGTLISGEHHQDVCLEKKEQDACDEEEAATFQVRDSVEEEPQCDHNSPKKDVTDHQHEEEESNKIMDSWKEDPAVKKPSDGDDKEDKDEAEETSCHAKRTRQHYQTRQILSSPSKDNTNMVTLDKVGEVDDEEASPPKLRGRAKKSRLTSGEHHHYASLKPEECTVDEEESTFQALDSLEEKTLHDHKSPKEDMLDNRHEKEGASRVVDCMNEDPSKKQPLSGDDDDDDEKRAKDKAGETSQHAKRTRQKRQTRPPFSSSSEDDTSLVKLDKVGDVDEEASLTNRRGRAKTRSRMTSGEHHRDVSLEKKEPNAGGEEEATFQVLDSVEEETLHDHISPKSTDNPLEEESNAMDCLNEGPAEVEPLDGDEKESQYEGVETSQCTKRTRQGRQKKTKNLVTQDKMGEVEREEPDEVANWRGRAKKRSRLTSGEHHHDASLEKEQNACDEEEATFQVLDSVEDETLHDHKSPKKDMTDNQLKKETTDIMDSLNEGPAEVQPSGGDEKEIQDEDVETSQCTKRTRRGRPKKTPRLVTQDKVGEIERAEPEEVPKWKGRAKKRSRPTSGAL